MPIKILDTRGTNYVPFEAEASPNSHLGGACVARMILNSDKVNPTAPTVPDAVTLANQQSMYTTLHAKNVSGEPDTWYVDPEAMRLVLNDADTGPRIYVELASTNRDLFNGQLIYTVDHYQVAPAALTGDGSYWVAIVGYSTDAAGAALGFNLHDPSWDAGLAAFSFVSATTWNSVYLKDPVRASSPRWGGKFVAVVDPEPGNELPAAPRLVKRPGDRIIPPEEIEGLIREGVEDLGIVEQPEIRTALERGQASRPQLIQVVDDAEAPYYLVQYAAPDERGAVHAKVAVDARYGDVICLTASEEPWRTQLTTRAQVLKALTGRPIRVPRPIRDLRAELLAEPAFAVTPSPAETRELHLQRNATADALLLAARQSTDVVILRAETTEVSSSLMAASSVPATYLSPSYRVTSGNITLLARAYASSELQMRPGGEWHEPWWLDIDPLGG